MAAIIESPHPYTAPSDNTYTYQIPGARKLRVTFDPASLIDWYDELHITDGDGNEYPFSPFYGDEMTAGVFVIYGDTVNVRLVAFEGSGAGWGFAVTEVLDISEMPDFWPFDTGDFPKSPAASFAGNAGHGVIEHDGAYYTIQRTYVPPGDDTLWELRAYKSTDGGRNWTLVGSPIVNAQLGNFYYDAANSKIYVYYAARVDDVGPKYQEVRRAELNLTTDTWSAPVTGGPYCGKMGHGMTVVGVHRSDGMDVVFFDRNITYVTGQPADVYYATWDGLTWSASVRVGGLAGEYSTYGMVAGIMLSAADLIHFFYKHWNGSTGIGPYYHRSLTASGILGSVQTLTGNTEYNTFSQPVLWNGKICVAYIDESTGYPRMMYGTNAANASPVWTSEQISTDKPAFGAGVDQCDIGSIVDGSGNLNVFYAIYPETIRSDAVVNSGLLMRVINSGAGWGVPAIFFVDQPSQGYEQDWLHMPGLGLGSDGTLLVTIDRIRDDGEGATGYQSIGGFLTLPPAEPPVEPPVTPPATASYIFTW